MENYLLLSKEYKVPIDYILNLGDMEFFEMRITAQKIAAENYLETLTSVEQQNDKRKREVAQYEETKSFKIEDLIKNAVPVAAK